LFRLLASTNDIIYKLYFTTSGSKHDKVGVEENVTIKTTDNDTKPIKTKTKINF